MTASAPLLLLPGLMCDAHVWAPQVAAFPGAEVADYGDVRTIELMAARALAQAPDRFSLAGHSMGARVAMEVWRTAPHRIERLALISTGIHLPGPGEADKRLALVQLGREQGIEALIDAWLLPMIRPEARDEGALVEPLRAMCRRAGQSCFEAQIAALILRPEIASLLPTVTVPALIAVGREDAWSPIDQHREMAALIPGAELSIFDHAGHMCTLEAPEAVNAALAHWLARTPTFA